MRIHRMNWGNMKTSHRMILAAAIGTLFLQGCAATGDTRADSQAAVPVQARQAAPTASTTAIPEEPGQPVVKADTKDNFEAVAAAIRQQMTRGGRWEFVGNEGRRTVDQRFADMRILFDQYGSVDKMDSTARARLLTDQPIINDTLTRYDGNRLVCTQEIPTGTHFPKKVCRTYAEMRREQDDAQFMMRQNAKNHPVTGH